jgi:chemotaxis protein CheX
MFDTRLGRPNVTLVMCAKTSPPSRRSALANHFVASRLGVTFMRAEFINPFLVSTAKTFKTMLGCEIKRGDLNLQTGKLHEVSGIIGLSGRAVGTVILSFSEQVSLKIASTLLLVEADEVNDDVIDAIGEITNMVAGAAKAELAEYEMSISLPSVITGGRHRIRFPSNVVPISVPYETPWGPMKMEVGLTPVAEPAHV